MKRSILLIAVICIASHGQIFAQQKNVSEPLFNTDKEQDEWNKKHHPTSDPKPAPARPAPAAPQKTYTPPPQVRQVNIDSRTTTNKKKN